MKGIILAGGAGTRLYPSTIACLEEIAFINKFIDKDQLLKLAQSLNTTDYGKYLFEIAKEKN